MVYFNLALHLAALFHHQVFSLYYIEGIMTTFVPLMGRSGPSMPSDVIIGILVSILTNYHFMCHVSFYCASRYLSSSINATSFLFISGFLCSLQVIEFKILLLMNYLFYRHPIVIFLHLKNVSLHQIISSNGCKQALNNKSCLKSSF